MLSLSPAFIAAFEREDVRPRYWVEIDDGTTQWVAVSGSMDPGSDLYGTPEGVLSVSSISSKTDPLTREVEVSEIVVDFEDAFLRPIIVNNRIRGQRVTVKMGAAELDLADFVLAHTGPIEEIEPDGKGQAISVGVMDVLAILKNTTITHAIWNKHPLEHIHSALLEAGIPSSLIDASAFDPSQPQYAAISHYVISKNADLNTPGGGALASPFPAYDIITEISQLLMGQLIVREDGKLSFSIYNAGASPVEHLDADNIIPETVKQVEDPSENLINRVQIGFWLDFDLKQVNTLIVEDTASQSNYAYPGATSRVATYDLKTNWINAWCKFVGDEDGLIQPTDTTIKAEGGILHGFCGFRDAANPPQQSWATISASRPLIIQLRDKDRRSLKGQETVRCQAVYIPANEYSPVTFETLPSDGSPQSFTEAKQVGYGVELQSLTRGYGAGSAQTWDRKYSAIWDITIIWDLARKLLERFADGFYRVELEASFLAYGVQRGDVVTLDWPAFVGFGLDGIDSGSKWEVIEKEPDLFADPPRVKLTLASMKVNTPSFNDFGFEEGTRAGREGFDQSEAGGFEPYIPDLSLGANTRSGTLRVTAGSGLAIDIAPGMVSDGRKSLETVNGYSGFPVPANCDVYLFADAATGQINSKAVANGAAAPAKLTNETPLAKVVTDASGVANIFDLRNSGGLRGNRLVDGSTPRGVQEGTTQFAQGLNYNPTFSQRTRG